MASFSVFQPWKCRVQYCHRLGNVMKYYEANLDERDGTKMWFCFQVTLPWRSCKTMLNNKDHRAMEMLCTVLSQVRK